MWNKRLVTFVGIAMVALSVGGTLSSTDASAKTYKSKVFAAKQLSQHKFKKSYIKYTRGGLIYTTRSLKHWSHKGANYSRTKWTTNQSVTVKKTNGKKAVYYYIKNKNNGIKGWIWRGYLKDTPAKVSTTPKKLATAKKVTGITKSMSTKTVLSKPVSNTNANGVQGLNDIRQGLQKWYTLMQTHPAKFSDLQYAKDMFEDNYYLYKSTVLNSKTDSFDKDSLKYITGTIKIFTTLNSEGKYGLLS